MTKEEQETQGFRSRAYWQRRYRQGGNSGAGSYGRLATYKADYINDLVQEKRIENVIEFGSGDGNQASLFKIKTYTGIDVSPRAVRQCRQMFSDRQGWQFGIADETDLVPHDMAMSLDVIYHLVEDDVFEKYMFDLFAYGKEFVLIYSSDKDEQTPNRHVRHRRFTDWIEEFQPAWYLVDSPDNPYELTEGESETENSFARFHLFAKKKKK